MIRQPRNAVLHPGPATSDSTETHTATQHPRQSPDTTPHPNGPHTPTTPRTGTLFGRGVHETGETSCHIFIGRGGASLRFFLGTGRHAVDVKRTRRVLAALPDPVTDEKRQTRQWT